MHDVVEKKRLVLVDNLEFEKMCYCKSNQSEFQYYNNACRII